MTALKKPIWAEGVLLGQQHFQQWDHYLEGSQHFRSKTNAPLSWGISELVLDTDALENGNFRVMQCKAITAEGQLIDFDSNDGESINLALTATPGQMVNVYLTLPNSQTVEGINGYHETAVGGARWKADYQTVADHYDSSREREVMFGRMNLQLSTDQQNRDGSQAIKIAELNCEGDKRFSLVKTFIPSVTQLKASFELQEICRRLIEIVSAKIRILEERRNQFRGEVTEFGHSDLSHFLLLSTLNSCYPELMHLHQHQEFHPERLYHVLTRMCGSLCSFSEHITVHRIPSYSHDNLTETFSQTEALANELLELVMPTRMSALNLRRESDTLYSVDSIDSAILSASTFFIAVSFEADDPSWISQFARQVKIGSRAAIEMIVASALPGVTLVHMQRPPNKLPIKTGYEYFRLEPKGNFWEQLKTEQTLGMFLPKDFMQATVELVTVQE